MYQAEILLHQAQIMENKMTEEETTTEQEVEVTTTDMLNNIISGNSADAQSQFADLMHSRTTDALDTLRQEKAQAVFSKSVDPNMEPTGVSLDDALVDIDTTTGRPVEDENT
jgi:hypothetical protein